MGIIRYLKSLFGVYETGYEYWVYLKDIKVNPEWCKTKIGSAKFTRKIQYWYKTGNFESRIVLDRDFNLINGYSSVVIARIKHIDKVPVYFV